MRQRVCWNKRIIYKNVSLAPGDEKCACLIVGNNATQLSGFGAASPAIVLERLCMLRHSQLMSKSSGCHGGMMQLTVVEQV